MTAIGFPNLWMPGREILCPRCGKPRRRPAAIARRLAPWRRFAAPLLHPAIQWKGGHILWSGGHIAQSSACCCTSTSPTTCNIHCPPVTQPTTVTVDISGLPSPTSIVPAYCPTPSTCTSTPWDGTLTRDGTQSQCTWCPGGSCTVPSVCFDGYTLGMKLLYDPSHSPSDCHWQLQMGWPSCSFFWVGCKCVGDTPLGTYTMQPFGSFICTNFCGGSNWSFTSGPSTINVT